MRLVIKIFAASLSIVFWLTLAAAQTAVKKAAEEPAANTAPIEQAGQTSAPEVWIHLVGGRRMQVDDVTQTAEGIWYTRDNVSTFLEPARVLRIERAEDRPPPSTPHTYAGTGRWKISDSAKVENFFLSQLKRPLPLTAFGQSELHTRWGLDHSQGMDVGLHPDSPEGRALIKFLLSEEIPFLAFRVSVPGVATGPHIHIGNGSPRMRPRQ